MPLVDLASDVISDLRQVRTFIDGRGGLVNRKGQPLGVAGLYGQLMRQAVAIFDRLGIGPAARAQVLTALGAERPRAVKAMDTFHELQRLYGPDS